MDLPFFLNVEVCTFVDKFDVGNSGVGLLCNFLFPLKHKSFPIECSYFILNPLARAWRSREPHDLQRDFSHKISMTISKILTILKTSNISLSIGITHVT